MRKRRLTRTGSAKHKRGYKLTNLTKSEARQRAIKAWVTKHANYKYGNPHRFTHADVKGSAEFERRAKEEASRAQRLSRRLENITDPDELEAALRAEWSGPAEQIGAETHDEFGEAVTSISKPGRISDAVWHAKVIEERNYYAKHHQFKDREFANYIRSSRVTNRERAAFLASTRQMEAYEERQHKSYRNPLTGDVVSEIDLLNKVPRDVRHMYEPVTESDKGYISADDPARATAQTLHELVNKDPSQRTSRRKQTPEQQAQYQRVLDQHLGQVMHQAGGMRDDEAHVRYQESERLKTHAQSLRHRAEMSPDPQQADILRRRANQIDAERQQTSQTVAQRLKHHIEQSHFYHSDNSAREGRDTRAYHAEEARKLINKISQKSGAQEEQDRVVREVRADFGDVEAKLQPEIPEDTRDEITKLNAQADEHRKNMRAAGNRGDHAEAKAHRDKMENAQRQAARLRVQNIEPDLPAKHDPRLASTVEEEYARYGHDSQNFARSRFELARLGARLRGVTPPDPSDYEIITSHGRAQNKPEWFQEARQQNVFHRRQREHRREALEKGHATFGINEKGDVVPLNKKTQSKVAWGVTANKDWEYTLAHAPSDVDPDTRQRKAPRKERLDFFDTQTEFHVGRRHTDTGKLYQGDYDEIMDVNLRQKYTDPLVFTEGSRKFKHTAFNREFMKHAKEKGIDDVVIVPIRGTQGMKTDTRLAKDKKTVYYQRLPGARVATAQDYQRTAGGWGEGTEFGAGDTRYREINRAAYDALDDNERGSVNVPRKVQYVYTSPEHVTLGSGQSDQVSFQPFARRGEKKNQRIDEAVRGVHVRGDKPSWRDARVITNLEPDTARDKVIGNYVRAKQQREFETKAAHAWQSREKLHSYEGNRQRALRPDQREGYARGKGFSGYDEMSQFATAAGAAGLYQARNRIVEGTLPNIANKAINTLRKVPFLEKQFGETWNEHTFDVNEAYLRPMQEKIANLGYSIRHPFSSTTGTSYGVDWGRWKYRENWYPKILGGTDLREARRIERQENMVRRVFNTRQYVRKHREDTGILGSIRNWRMEPMMKHRDYKHFFNADEAGESFISRYKDFTDAYLGTDKENPFAEFVDPISKKKVRVRVTNKMRKEARGFRNYLNRIENYHGPREGVIDELPPRPPRPPKNWRNFVPDPKKPTTIAAGVAVAALAAHYGHHKYVESKKPEDERTAYYNKVLPKAFDIPWVNVRKGTTVRTPNNALFREFGLEDRKITSSLIVGRGTKHVALRPMDHGLDPNAPIFGGLRSGRTKGGSFGKSLMFEQRTLREQRRRRPAPNEYGVTIKGRKVPMKFEVGRRQEIELKARNPNRFTQEDRDNVVWAHHGTPYEDAVKAFYSYGDRDKIVDMFEDPEEIRRIQRQKGDKAQRKLERSFYGQRNK